MYRQRLEVDLYLELLNQIREGNADEDTISEKIKLSKQSIIYALSNLESKKLLKKSNKKTNEVPGYRLTKKGTEFIDYVGLPDKIWK